MSSRQHIIQTMRMPFYTQQNKKRKLLSIDGHVLIISNLHEELLPWQMRLVTDLVQCCKKISLAASRYTVFCYSLERGGKPCYMGVCLAVQCPHFNHSLS